MADPITVDIPHKLGRAEARRRISEGIGQLIEYIPGSRLIDPVWKGDTMAVTLEAMGQRIAAQFDVGDDKVHAILELPPLLALFTDKLRAGVTAMGPKLLR